MTFILQLLFAIIMVNFVVLSFILLRTRNGLKPEFLIFFLTLAWASLVRTIEPVLTAIPTEIVSLAVALPIAISGLYLVVFLLWTRGQGKE